ncbi:MAG: hypothetical protein ACRC7S_16910 [Cetobacterium sp.]
MNIFKRLDREEARINVKVYKEIRDEIERIADYEFCTITQIVVAALTEFIERHKKKEKRVNK